MNHFARFLRHATAAAAALALSLPALAADQPFYGIDYSPPSTGAGPNATAARDAFLAALSGHAVGVENFESLTPGSFASSSVTLSFAGSGVTGTLASAATIFARIDGGPSVYGRGTSGTQFLDVASYGNGVNNTLFTLTFSQPVTAFGFFGNNISDYIGFGGLAPSQQVSLDGRPGVDVLNVDPRTINAAPVLFFGIKSDTPFTEVRLILPAGSINDNAAIDDMLVAAAVPEPASALLLLAGMAAVGVLRRRV